MKIRENIARSFFRVQIETVYTARCAAGSGADSTNVYFFLEISLRSNFISTAFSSDYKSPPMFIYYRFKKSFVFRNVRFPSCG